MRTLYKSITGGIDASSIEISESYGQPTAKCSITTDDVGSLDLGDTITVDMGFSDEHGTVFKGIIQNINSERLPGQHIIEANDILIKAVQHMIVSTDLDNPFRRRNISMEDLVGDLLEEADITDYEGDASSFTLGTGELPVEFQLVFSMDAINQVCQIIVWHCYADQDGTVHFENIQPIPTGGAVATYTTGNSGNILVINRSLSTDNLRNRVVVFGKPPIFAEASAPSPYLPAGFYKTAVISTPLIDTQDMADTAASYNLTAWNRLTESMSVEALGDYARHARQTVTVTEAWSGASGDYFIHDMVHTLDTSYRIRMNLVR